LLFAEKIMQDMMRGTEGRAMPERISPDVCRKIFRTKKIGVLMGGLSSEREISLRTGNAILTALKERGYQAVALDVGRSIAAKLSSAAIDVAFIALHGMLGEDGSIQGLLEIMGVPYTGSGVFASALAMNKVAAKKIFAYHNLPTPAFHAVCLDEAGCAEEALKRMALSYPVIIKPSEEGSTIGVTIVQRKEQLFSAVRAAGRYGKEILAEEFISGREITVGILGDQALPIIEIIPRNGFYDFQAKYKKGETAYLFPEWLSAAQEQEIKALALGAFQALGCCGAARVDFMVNRDSRPFILEINTIPGMTETSLLPKAAARAGIAFADLVEKILWSASVHKQVPQHL
jgi:D-alanine-D-alanine ligase